jgi:hypothetical protein
MKNYWRHCGCKENQDTELHYPVTRFELLPVEIGLQSLRVTGQGSIARGDRLAKFESNRIV